MAFTDRQIKNLKPSLKPYTLSGGDIDRGLNVRVLTTGTVTFYHVYAHPHTHKKTRIKLGRYPDISLKDAREMAQEHRSLIAKGKDPQLARDIEKTAQLQAASVGTVEQLVAVYIDNLKAKGKKSYDEINRVLQKDLIPTLGNLPANEISTLHIQRILADVADRPVLRNRLRAYIQAAFNVGIKYDYDDASVKTGIRFDIDVNPVTRIPRKKEAEVKRDRVLSYREIEQVINSPIQPRVKSAFKLLIMTGARVTEILHMPMSEINWINRTWTLSKERSKNKQPNTLPLTETMVEVIKNAWDGESEWLFPNKTGKAPVVKNVLNEELKKVEIPPFKPMDTRRTMKTLCVDEGMDELLLNVVQNHNAPAGVSREHYNRSEYLLQKKNVLEQWEKRLKERSGF